MNKTTKVSLILFLLINSLAAQNYSTNGEIYFEIGGQELTIPSRHVKFAKKIMRYETKNTKSFNYKIKRKKIQGKSISYPLSELMDHIEMSSGDIVVLRFKKNQIKDVNGADIYFFADKLKGQAEISISKDNETWTPVGNITESKRYINLSGKIEYGAKYRFLKIRNTSNDGSMIKLRQVAIIKPTNGDLGMKAKIIDGEVYTKSDKINLQINDFRQFDGDLISVKVNGKVLSKKKLLTKWNRFVEIPLRNGENTIIVKALTEGMLKPNTIDLKIVDGIIINIGSYKIRKNRTKTIRVFRD